MRILWLCNVAIPAIMEDMKKPVSPFGGWLVSTADAVLSDNKNELVFCFPQFNTRKTIEGTIGNLLYFGYYEAAHNNYLYSAETEQEFIRILNKVQPDIIHIWGTEYPRALAMMNATNATGVKKTIISIQGLSSLYANHYINGVPVFVQHHFTVRDFLRRDNLKNQYRKFCRQGYWETEALKRAGHVIGRTEWDRAGTCQLAPNAEYHFCAESLRSSFYESRWDLTLCEKHSIFVSQCAYPLKGFHYVLSAMPIILKHYPDTKLYTTGQDVRKIPWYKLTSYQKYLARLINRLHLNDNVVFTGVLNEQQIKEQYLKSHVFVSASSIENSPNSVGEAMLLGMPIVASYVGGTMDMFLDKEEGFLYQPDAAYMLAHYVCKVFSDDALACRMGEAAHKHAYITHDRNTNIKTLMSIYKRIIVDE